MLRLTAETMKTADKSFPTAHIPLNNLIPLKRFMPDLGGLHWGAGLLRVAPPCVTRLSRDQLPVAIVIWL